MSQEALNLLNIELEKHVGEMDAYKQTTDQLQQMIDGQHNEDLGPLCEKYLNLMRDKEQIIVNIKLAIKKMNAALEQADKVEKEILSHFQELINIAEEKKMFNLPELPTDEIEMALIRKMEAEGKVDSIPSPTSTPKGIKMWKKDIL